MRSRTKYSITAATLLVIAACGDGGGGGGSVGLRIARTPASSGNGQTGAVGAPLPQPLRVIVTDNGAPAVGQTVTWATANPGGSLAPIMSITGADGIATSQWTLGSSAGAQSATATLTGASGSPVTFTATATVVTLSKAPDPNGNGAIQTVGGTVELRARVTQGATPQSGVMVTWSTASGSVNPTSSQTDGSGIATTTWTLGAAAGTETADASLAGAIGSPQTYTVDAVALNTVLVVDNRFGPSPLTVSSGTQVTFLWGQGSVNHSVLPSSANPAAIPNSGPGTQNAPFSFAATFSTAGNYRYYCSVHGNHSPGTGDVSGMSGSVVVTP